MRISVLGCTLGIMTIVMLGALSAAAEEFAGLFPGDWQELGRAEVVRDEELVTVANGTLADLTPVGDCEFSFRGRAPTGSERTQIWGAVRVKDGESRYVIGLRGMPEPQLSFARYAPDNESVFFGCSPLVPAPEAGEWHGVRVVTIGNRFLVFLNDETTPRLDFTDPDPLWADGGIGIGGGWLPTEFKDVQVTPLTKERRSELLSGPSVLARLNPKAMKINFQPSGEPLVPGWLVDDGSVYNADRGYGWDKKILTRLRKKSADLLYDSLVGIAHSTQDGTFLMDLTDGEYLARVQLGDPGGRIHFSLTVQDNPDDMLTREVGGKEPLVVEKTVSVTDGKLRLHFSRPTQGGISVNWLTVEKRADVSAAEWDAVVAANRPDTDKEARRVANRAAYKPVTVSSLPAVRGEISLDGQWLFMPGQGLSGEEPVQAQYSDQKWHTITVPGTWGLQENWLYRDSYKSPSDRYFHELKAKTEAQTFDWRSTGIGWYRHYLDLPENTAEREFILEFAAISKISEVWVNGIKVGGETGMFRDVTCDITGAVKPGRNVIAVKAVGIPEQPKADDAEVKTVAVTVDITASMLRSLPQGIGSGIYGIWQPVKLIVANPARVEDVFVQPELDSAEMAVELANNTTSARDLMLSYRIVDAETKAVLTSGKAVGVTVPANGTATRTLQTTKVQPKLWSPHDPNLYVLELTLTQSGKVVDQHKTRFGFRTFTVEGKNILLNGKPYLLRGGCHTPGAMCYDDEALARRFIRLAREGNVMLTRNVCLPSTRTWMDIGDELGFGTSYEGPWPWLMIKGEPPEKALLKIWKEEFLALVKRYRNHPSLLIWTVSNEMNFAKLDEKDPALMKRKWTVLDDMIRCIREVDPTRPIVPYSGYERDVCRVSTKQVLIPNNFDDGDIDDLHHYAGWYNVSFFSLFNGELKGYASANRPLISQELSTGYPRNDDWPGRSYQYGRYVPQALVGMYAYEQYDPAIFMTRQAFMTKELTEVIRRTNRKDCQGLMPFAYLTWFTDVWSSETIRPKVTYYEIAKALQPVLVSAELSGRHFYAGTVATRRVCLINDAEDTQALPVGKLVWEVRIGGSVLTRGEQSTPSVAYYANEWLKIDFKIPSKLPALRVDAKLVLTYTVAEKEVSENSYDILLATKAWSAADASKRKVQVFDPDSKLCRWLPSAQTQTVKSKLKPGLPLLATNLDGLIKQVGKANLIRFVEAGGRVLLHHPGQSLVTHLPEQIKSFSLAGRGKTGKGEIVSFAIPESPLFDALEPLDLSWFEMGPGEVPYACSGRWLIDRTRADVSAPAHQCDFHSPVPTRDTFHNYGGAPIVEIRLGKGLIIASEMMLSAKDKDPVAARLFANMLNRIDQ